MKKILPLICVASLLANAAFLTGTFQSLTSVAGAAASTTVTSNTGHVGTGPAKLFQAKPMELAEVLKAKNLVSLRDYLRAAGLPESTIRTLVASLIRDRYSERMKALRPKPDPNMPWWKEDMRNEWNDSTLRANKAELRRLEREADSEVAGLLGPDSENSAGEKDPKFSFLSADKRKSIQAIEQDYEDLIDAAQFAMQEFRLPSDAEQIKLLMNEKKRDLAAALTPQELADYDLRLSDTALELRSNRFDFSESEYRNVFAIQKAWDDTQDRDAWGNMFDQSPGRYEKLNADMRRLYAQIKTALGAERYADYTMSNQWEYKALVTASKRLSLPPETARQVFALRATVSAESVRIVDSPDLAVEQKKQALIDLAQRTQDQIRARLGEAATDTYVSKYAEWLNSVKNGEAVIFDEDYGSVSTRGITPSPKIPAAK